MAANRARQVTVKLIFTPAFGLIRLVGRGHRLTANVTLKAETLAFIDSLLGFAI
jgi:hypothetical protein